MLRKQGVIIKRDDLTYKVKQFSLKGSDKLEDNCGVVITFSLIIKCVNIVTIAIYLTILKSTNLWE